MKIALVHDYLKVYGGAERVLEVFHEIYPEAPIFTSFYLPDKMPDNFRSWDIRTHPIQKTPLISSFSKAYTFMYPLVFESFDFSNFDVIISSTANFAKGIITKPKTMHVSYIHNIPRFLYHYPTEINRRRLWFLKPILTPLDNYLRIWDQTAAKRPDYIVVNSKNVQKRVNKFYRRDSTVIYPPVTLPRPKESPKNPTNEKYFLVVSRLESFKNVDIAIDACKQLNLPLKVIGTGKMRQIYGKLASNSKIEFLDFVDDHTLASYYANCEALIFPSDEDFGLTPVESMFFGKPVIALGNGGALETVIPSITGEFFDKPTVESLKNVLSDFNGSKYNAQDCISQAEKFNKENFKKTFKEFVDSRWEEYQNARTSGS